MSGSGAAAEYEDVPVDPEFPILPDTAVSASGDFIYVLSSSKVRLFTFNPILICPNLLILCNMQILLHNCYIQVQLVTIN